jgi:transposase
MPTYQPYSPEQAELLPAHVKDVLGADRLCFVVHEVVEAYDLSPFEKQEEDAGGQRPYDPRMLLKIWLYGFRVNVRRTRKLEQRIREDLGFRYSAGGATPDHKDAERISSAASRGDHGDVHRGAAVFAARGDGSARWRSIRRG